MIELIERDAQLAQLRSCAAAASGGAGNVVLVSGEAGIGKTSLVKEFVRQCPTVPLWWGSCDALQTPQPLAPLHDIARSANARFGSLLDGRVKTMALFAEVIRELQSLGPALVVIEDAHWADESTLDFITFLGRRIDRTRAVMIVTFRQDEVSLAHPLRKVIGDLPPSLVTRIELPRLSPEGVVTLARHSLRSATGLHEATGGNPFFLTELLRHGSAGVPHSVQDLVLARLARLPATAREIVQLAAIVPARIERWLVDEMLAPTPADIEQCLDCGLLLGDASYLYFRHELARVSVETANSLPLTQALHSRALDALVRRAAQGGYAARLVHHATHASARDAVLAFAPVAAREARDRSARREAAAHYRTALRFVSDAQVHDHVDLLDAYAVECQATSQLGEAIAARQKIATLLSASGKVHAQARNFSQLAVVQVLALRNDEADASSRRAIALLEGLPPSPELANAYRVESQLRMLSRDCRRSVEWGTKAIALAQQHGDKVVLAAAYGTLGAATLFLDYDAGCGFLERALDIALADEPDIALAADLDYIAANSYSNLGSGSCELFRLPAAQRYLQSAIEFSTRNEIDFYRNYSLASLALCELFRGHWDDSEAYSSEVVETSPEHSTSRIMALCALGRLRTRRGDIGAQALLDEALELALASGTLQRVAPVRIARAEAAYQRADHAKVIAEAGAALDLARQHEHPWYVGELSYWLSREGAAIPPATECAEPYALQLSGQWREAAQAWAALECPYEQARALCDGTQDARIEALAIFERLKAAPQADALRKELRQAGVKGVPRGPRPSTQRNPRGLTAREVQILELLCGGLKNSEIADRLFRSVRTVEHHLDAILGKLGAKSRAEVIAIAHRDGLVASKMGSSPAQSP